MRRDTTSVRSDSPRAGAPDDSARHAAHARHRSRGVVAGALLMIAALTGCAGAVNDRAVDTSAEYSTGVPEYDAGSDQAAEAAGTGDGSGATGTEVRSETMIVTGSAVVRVDDPETALTEIAAAAADTGGSVESSSVSVYEEQPYAELVVRIPAEEFQPFVESLDDWGEMIRQETSAEEVGQQLADINARIAALETSIARLSEMLTQTESVTELLEVEGMMTERQAELDGLTAQLAWLEDQVALSTLTVTLTTQNDDTGYRGGPSAWERAWSYFTDSLAGILYFLAIALPWLLVLGACAVLARWVILRRRARRAGRNQNALGGEGVAGTAPAPADSAPSPEHSEVAELSDEDDGPATS